MRSPVPRLHLVAAGVFLGPLIAYWWTAKPSVDFWDTGELQTVPYMLGIAHPTGFPTFILLGWLFTHIVPLGNVAWRTTLMCAVAMSGASVLSYRLALRLCGSHSASSLAAMFFASGAIVWSYATRTEVQALSLVLRALAIWQLTVWNSTLERRHLFAGWLSFGLAESTHGIAMLALPGLIVLSIPKRRCRAVSAAATAVAGVAIGMLPYLYLPIRSTIVTHLALDPTASLGFAGGMPFWDYNHPSTLDGFIRLTTGRDFDVREGLLGIFDVRRYVTFIQYLCAREWRQFAALCIVALYGILAQYRRERGICISLLLLALVPVPFLNSYGALADPDRYFLLTLWITSVFIAVALAELIRGVAQMLPSSRQAIARVAILTLLAAGLVFQVHRSLGEFAAQRSERSADAFIAEVRRVTPQDSIIVAAWNYATPLAYAAYVQRSMAHRVIVVAWPNQYAERYKDWLRARPVFLASDWGLDVPNYAVLKVPGSTRSLYKLHHKNPGVR